MISTIFLSRGLVAKIDTADYAKIAHKKWHASPNGRTFYALARQGKKRIQMHVLIKGVRDGMEVDHKDGDGLNNVRKNLRHLSHQKNMHNRRVQRNSTTGFTGVHKRNDERFEAKIAINGRRLFIGYFSTAEDASSAVEAKRKKVFRGEK